SWSKVTTSQPLAKRRSASRSVCEPIWTSAATSAAPSSGEAASTRSDWPSAIAAWCVMRASWPPPTMPTIGRPVRVSIVGPAYRPGPGAPELGGGGVGVGDRALADESAADVGGGCAVDQRAAGEQRYAGRVRPAGDDHGARGREPDRGAYQVGAGVRVGAGD